MKRLFPYLAFVLIWVGFSYPFFFQGKIPAPLDFLVNFYIPWDNYNDFPVKNPAISDVVSQIIPWKIFNANEMRAGRIPIWNPLNLAGTPQLGNWQSGVLYPTNWLFLLLPIKTAWSLHILFQPLLAGWFTILYLRSLKVSKVASLFGALAFSYGGFMTTWLEWGTLGHAMLYLPLALFAVDKVESSKYKVKSSRYLFLLYAALALSWLAGHPQLSLYITIMVSIYYAFRFWNNYKNKFKLLIVISLNCYIVPLLIAAPQVLPGVQTYLGSVRDMVDGRSWAKAFLIKPYGLFTFLAPDFFGNPVTRNNWSDFSYVEMSGYIGIVGLVLVSVSLKKSDLTRKFAVVMIAICLLLAVDNPISRWIINLKLPMISSSSPARLMGIISFWLAILAAKGMDDLKLLIKNNQLRKILLPVGIIGMLLIGMWLWTFVSQNPNISVARRNLIWPSFIFLAFLFFITITRRQFLLLAICLSLLAMSDLFRFHHKFVPYSNSEYWYPEIPVLTTLKKLGGRSFGLLDANLNLSESLASLDGYDPLIQQQYVELTYPKDKLMERNRITGPFLDKGMSRTIDLLNKLGVKWIAQPVIHGANSWELRLWEYPNQFIKIWSDEKYEIFENTKAAGFQAEPVVGMRDNQRELFIIGIWVSMTTGILVLFWNLLDNGLYEKHK